MATELTVLIVFGAVMIAIVVPVFRRAMTTSHTLNQEARRIRSRFLSPLYRYKYAQDMLGAARAASALKHDPFSLIDWQKLAPWYECYCSCRTCGDAEPAPVTSG
jgi:hypothetical protein